MELRKKTVRFHGEKKRLQSNAKLPASAILIYEDYFLFVYILSAATYPCITA